MKSNGKPTAAQLKVVADARQGLAELRALVPAAIEAIEMVLIAGEPHDRLKAAALVLDRVHGRPHQSVEVTQAPGEASAELPLEEQRAMLAGALAAVDVRISETRGNGASH